jgi:hypothetical protein
MPDEGLELQGFSLYRADRGAESGKKTGGGVHVHQQQVVLTGDCQSPNMHT